MYRSPLLQLLTVKAKKAQLSIGELGGAACDLASFLRVACELQLFIWSIVVGRAFKYALKGVFELLDAACGLRLLAAIGLTLLSMLVTTILMFILLRFFKCIQASWHSMCASGRKIAAKAGNVVNEHVHSVSRPGSKNAGDEFALSNAP